MTYTVCFKCQKLCYSFTS